MLFDNQESLFKPFIIGIGLSPEQIKTFECVGTFFDYDNQNTFSEITNIIQQQKLNKKYHDADDDGDVGNNNDIETMSSIAYNEV